MSSHADPRSASLVWSQPCVVATFEIKYMPLYGPLPGVCMEAMLTAPLHLQQGTPTSERAVPVAIFSTEPAIARAFLRKWCGDICEGAQTSAGQVVCSLFPARRCHLEHSQSEGVDHLSRRTTADVTVCIHQA
jgi:hypothetical protein